jgi:site-specific recombinase XerD
MNEMAVNELQVLEGRAEVIERAVKTRYEQQKEFHEQQRQSFENEDIIETWLHGKSPKTKKVYMIDINRFLEFFNHKHLGFISEQELQFFVHTIEQTGLSAATRSRIISSFKSLFTHAHRIGAIPFNVGGMIKSPKKDEKLSERILTHQEVMKILVAAEKKKRDYTVIRLLYVTGIRISELCGLSWKNVKEREEGAQITVLGKGHKTRTVLIDQETHEHITALKDDEMLPGDPVFISQKGSALDPSSVWRMIKKHVKKAGIQAAVSPHWFRHAHASHSLDAGAPIHLVQQTLGHSNVATTGRYLHAKPSDSSSKYIKI